jgi:hypothetical protein
MGKERRAIVASLPFLLKADGRRQEQEPGPGGRRRIFHFPFVIGHFPLPSLISIGDSPFPIPTVKDEKWKMKNEKWKIRPLPARISVRYLKRY